MAKIAEFMSLAGAMARILIFIILCGYGVAQSAESMSDSANVESTKNIVESMESTESLQDSTKDSTNARDAAESVESMRDSTKSAPNVAESTRDSAKDSTQSALDSAKSLDFVESKSPQDSALPNYEFPKYNDLSFANSLIERFSLHNANYFLPAYYTFSGQVAPYRNIEVKFQISAKINLFSDLFCGIGVFFGYTQKSFFQMYSRKISAPFRDNDYMPEILFYRALDWNLLGGKIYNIRFGYRHLSNGEWKARSRSIERILAELMYQNGDFHAKLALWAYISPSPSNIYKYIGFGDLQLKYSFLERNHLYLTIGNLFHNYGQYRGNVLLEYRFDLNKSSIYVQYFYGYGDNTFQYNRKTHSVGIGLAINNVF